ncbi:hypothetical protein [Dongia sp.]|uniref:hypothetical protein n=1 Tax=Dongia sp. TaxID=1977262 RepID=UPI0035B0A862
MTDPLATDWFVVEVQWRGILLPYYHLSGVATGHELIPDGHRFISTAMQWISRPRRQAQTRNRLYRLGRECTLSEIRATDYQRIADYLDQLWSPPAAMRLAVAYPEHLKPD